MRNINDNLFDRLEIVRFFRLFTREGDIEYTGCNNIVQNTLRPKHRPDSHLAQISLRKGERERVLHCDGRFNSILAGLKQSSHLRSKTRFFPCCMPQWIFFQLI